MSVFLVSGLELVTPRLRTISGTILNCFYALGGIYLGLIAMWFRNYKVLLLITYAPAFVVLSYTYLLPQSNCVSLRDFGAVYAALILSCMFDIWLALFSDNCIPKNYQVSAYKNLYFHKFCHILTKSVSENSNIKPTQH